MAKKTVAIISAFLFILIFAGSVFAAFDDIYTTGSYGSTAIKTTFGWDEKPWLYLKFPASSDFVNNIYSTWTDPHGVTNSVGDTLSGSQVWLGFDTWNSIRTTGLWNVTANYSGYSGGPSGSGATTFTVTPEPISSALFLFGGLVLAAGYRKKKTKILKG